jgi:transposase
MGDAAKIAAKRVRKQKTDRLDAQHILKLMLKDDFPKIWVPSWENRDVRQLLWHRPRMVPTRTRIMNQLAALNEGLRYKKKLWRETGRQQLGGPTLHQGQAGVKCRLSLKEQGGSAWNPGRAGMGD